MKRMRRRQREELWKYKQTNLQYFGHLVSIFIKAEADPEFIVVHRLTLTQYIMHTYTLPVDHQCLFFTARSDKKNPQTQQRQPTVYLNICLAIQPQHILQTAEVSRFLFCLNAFLKKRKRLHLGQLLCPPPIHIICLDDYISLSLNLNVTHSDSFS